MNETTADATNIFAPIWRRKWLILAVALLVAVGSYLYFKRENPTFQSQTQVFMGVSAEEQALAGDATRTKSSTLSGRSDGRQRDRGRRSPSETAQGTPLGPHQEGEGRPEGPEKSEPLDITVEARSRAGSALLANLVAQAYVKRQETKRTRAIRREIAITRAQLVRIEAASAAREAASETASKSKKGAAGSRGASASSVDPGHEPEHEDQRTRRLAGAGDGGAAASGKAANAVLLSPKPRKDAVFGFVIGLLSACVAAVVASGSTGACARSRRWKRPTACRS